MKKVNVIIVDDHKLFREGIELILDSIENINTIRQASNGVNFLEVLEDFVPDIVLMDINMPEMDGITATKKAKIIHPSLKIIALSMLCEPEYYSEMTKAGVDGFLLKDTDSSELEKAINTVLDGNQYFSQELLQKIIRKNTSKSIIVEENVSISKRELQIIELISKGLSNKEIGEELFISKRTAEKHRYNLMEKTKSKNVVDILMFAIRNKLIEV